MYGILQQFGYPDPTKGAVMVKQETVVLAPPSTLEEVLLKCQWREELLEDFIPNVARLGGREVTAAEVAEGILEAVRTSKAMVSVNDQCLIASLVCGGTREEFIAKAMVIIRSEYAA